MKFTIIALIFLVACGHEPLKEGVIQRKQMIGLYFKDTSQRVYAGGMVLTRINLLEPTKDDSTRNEVIEDSLWQYILPVDSTGKLKSKLFPKEDSVILIQIPKNYVISSPHESKYYKH